eukprot:6804119-Pyramimonas_sp.AAC.1
MSDAVRARIAANWAEALRRRREQAAEQRRLPIQNLNLFGPPPELPPRVPKDKVQADLHRWFSAAIAWNS